MSHGTETTELSLNLPSPVETIIFENRTFFLKRDDLIHRDFSGNKARKFHYFLHNDFPHIKRVTSYGSSQSNAMYSLSVLAKIKGWKFTYYVHHISDYLKKYPHGNYGAALENGMVIYEQTTMKRAECNRETLFIEEGGREQEASYGIALLAQEIIDWQEENSIEALNLFLPSGTGTTALFLQKTLSILHMKYTTRVYTTPCVGDAIYLRKQFSMLEPNTLFHPTIVTIEKKHHFGKLYRENYKIWLKLRQQTGVVFDLLYDSIGWRVLMAHPEIYRKETLYLHQGGLLGNESMLPRYERKYKNKDEL